MVEKLFTYDPGWFIKGLMTPYRIEAFGELVIPKDWVFYTPLAERLRAANNEEAMQDLINLIVRVRRSRSLRYQNILGHGLTTNYAGKERIVYDDPIARTPDPR